LKLRRIRKIKKYPLGLKELDISFNDINWQIWIIAFDSTNDANKIRFLKSKDLDYDLNKIKITSRAISIINIQFKNTKNVSIEELIKKANIILFEYRNKTKDIFLSPFKWNTKNWIRRRRLDFKTARAILEEAFITLKSIKEK